MGVKREGRVDSFESPFLTLSFLFEASGGGWWWRLIMLIY
jgi:hypothetical protein